MATRTSVASGDWATAGTWDTGVPGNGDTAVIANGHSVRFDADESGFANGLALITVNAGGVFHVKASAVTYLKMNGNIDINGAFYIGERATVSDFTATESRTNVYQVARSLKTYSVEETLGTGFLAAWKEVMEAAIIAENARLRGLDENEMMADEVIAFIETTRASLTLADYLDYVEDNPGSFYHDVANNLLYIHTSDSTNPSTKTITAIEPINRPTAGTENRCTIMFNSSGQFTNTGGGTPVFQAYGWHPEREWTQLSGDVALNATELSALNHDLELQQSEKISIGSGNENGMPAETGKGFYTISSYMSGTKVATLSSGLVKERLKDDYVCNASRAIKITRSSGTNALMTVKFDNIILVGVAVGTYFIQNTTVATYSENLKISHCVSNNKVLAAGIKNSIITDSMRVWYGGSSSLISGVNNVLDRCIAISGGQLCYVNMNTISNSIQQNCSNPPPGISKNCVYKNFIVLNYGYKSEFINCSFSGVESDTYFTTSLDGYKFTDCTFKDNTVGYLKYNQGKLYNCLFEGATEINYTSELRLPHQIIESFDHNQIQGNYRAWMRGGTIETLTVEDVVQPGHLIYKPISEDYPVYRDYPVFFPANRITTYYVYAEKDFTGGTVQTEIIDPSNDPLIDSNALALDTALLEDVKDEQKTMRVAYKPDIGKQLILRVSVINGSGEVNVEKPLTFEKFRRKELI